MLSYTSHTEVIKDYLGTEQELQDAIIAGVEISNFQGGFEIDIAKLDEIVPSHFEGMISLDENENEIISDRKWWTYARLHESINEGKVLIECTGYIKNPDTMNCQDVILSEELYKWIAELGAESIHTKSIWKSLRKIEDPGI